MTTPTRLELQTALKAWFVEATGLDADKVQLAEQGAPAPALPYATIALMTEPEDGLFLDGGLLVGGVDLHAQHGEGELVVGFQTFGAEAFDLMRKARIVLADTLLAADHFRITRRILVTVVTGVDDTDYTVKINGAPVTINSGPGASRTTVRTALLAALQADPFIIVEASDKDSAGDPLPANEIALFGPPGIDYVVELAVADAPTDKLLQTVEVTGLSLSVIEEGNILDITTALETDFEQRRGMDVRFAVAIFEPDLSRRAGVIESTEITLEPADVTFTAPTPAP